MRTLEGSKVFRSVVEGRLTCVRRSNKCCTASSGLNAILARRLKCLSFRQPTHFSLTAVWIPCAHDEGKKGSWKSSRRRLALRMLWMKRAGGLQAATDATSSEENMLGLRHRACAFPPLCIFFGTGAANTKKDAQFRRDCNRASPDTWAGLSVCVWSKRREHKQRAKKLGSRLSSHALSHFETLNPLSPYSCYIKAQPSTFAPRSIPFDLSLSTTLKPSTSTQDPIPSIFLT